MTDPYKVLGVSRSSSNDEIKKAYRELAKKYHPDNYVNSPLSDLASEKMKEINDAYDTIMHERENAQNGSDNSNRSYNTSGSSSKFEYIRRLIFEHNLYEAEIQLNAVAQDERDAEWYYLMGCVFFGRSWYFEASKYWKKANELDPTNAEYAAALERLNNKQPNVERERTVSNICSICNALICADCCCEACGGDLIGCC